MKGNDVLSNILYGDKQKSSGFKEFVNKRHIEI
jgi:hypothetical protein